jgi:hypothetical protein
MAHLSSPNPIIIVLFPRRESWAHQNGCQAQLAKSNAGEHVECHVARGGVLPWAEARRPEGLHLQTPDTGLDLGRVKGDDVAVGVGHGGGADRDRRGLARHKTWGRC